MIVNGDDRRVTSGPRRASRWWSWALAASVACFAAAAAWVWWSAWHRPSWDRQMDLHVYMGAVRTVHDGLPLYKYIAPNGDPFTYPPFAVVAFWPLNWMSEPVARVVWTAATLVAVLAITAALFARRGIAGRRRYAAMTFVAAATLLLSAPVQSNIRFGQVSLFLVLLAFLDALDLTPRRIRGVPVGIAAAIKLTPLLFVPYLWITGRRRDALRAGGTFAACTGLTYALWPAASTAYWTDMIFTTSRIGNLAATGNQSINGALVRVGMVPPERALAWLALSVLVCVVALVGARQCYRAGRAAKGAVVVGCATVLTSPVSWTHHQVWLVLAGLLLVSGPRKARAAVGAVLVLGMTFSITGWLPRGFLADNARMLAALAVCTWGLAPLRHRAAAAVRLLPGVKLVVRPRTAMTYAAVLAVALAGIIVVVRESPVVVLVQTEDDHDETLWGKSTNGCGEFRQVPRADGSIGYGCYSAVDPVGGRQLNFGVGYGRSDGMVAIQGQVGPEVVRLVFVPVEGTQAISVPLLSPAPGSGPGTPPEPDTSAHAGNRGTPSGPVEDHRVDGARDFSILTTSTDHALLLAYDAAGHVVGEGGGKLRF